MSWKTRVASGRQPLFSAAGGAGEGAVTCGLKGVGEGGDGEGGDGEGGDGEGGDGEGGDAVGTGPMTEIAGWKIS